MSRDHGVKGAVRAALGEAAGEIEAALTDDEQLELKDLLPVTFDGEQGPERQRNFEQFHRARGVGRPRGAQNLITRQFREFVGKVFAYDPGFESVRWAVLSPEELAKKLKCTTLEAYDRLDKLHARLMPFWYAAMVATDADGKSVPFFQMVVAGENVQVNGAPVPPWMRDPEVLAAVQKSMEKQGLTEPPPGKSHDDKSHDEPSS